MWGEEVLLVADGYVIYCEMYITDRGEILTFDMF